MAFVNKLNYNANGNLVSNEVITLTGTNKVYKFAHNNVMQAKGVSVWTGFNSTGTKITDFVISNTDKAWVQQITFGAGVASGTYYVTYYSEGDENDADDINEINQKVDSLMTGKLLAEYKYVPEWKRDSTEITIDLSANTFTIPNHGLIVGDILIFTVQKGESTVAPNGYVAGKSYYVRSINGDTFALNTANDDTSVVDVTNTGTIGAWRLEKKGLISSFEFNNLDANVLKLIIKGGGFPNGGQLLFKVNGVGDSDTYMHNQGSANGVQGTMYPSFFNTNNIIRLSYLIDFICSNNAVNAFARWQWTGNSNATSQIVRSSVNTSLGYAQSKNDSRFDKLRQLEVILTNPVYGDFTIEVWGA